MKDDTSSLSGRLRPLGFQRYSEYLASDHWQDVRRRYRESDLPQICPCGETRVALHHTTYVRLGEELLEDLTPLCRDCHARAHGRKPRRRRRKGKFKGVTIRHDPSIVGQPF